MDKKTARNFIIILVVTFIVMIIAFHNDYQNIIKMFSNINVMWFIVCIIMMIIANLADIYFIYFYCKRHYPNYTFRNAIDAQQTGNFFSAITPFASGGQFAQVIVFNKQSIASNRSASLLMLTFISWQTVLVIFTTLALIFNYNQLSQSFNAFFSLVFVGFGINVIVIVGLFLSAFSMKFHTFLFNTAIPLVGKIKIGKFRVFKDPEKKKTDAKVWLGLFRDEFQSLLLHKDIMFTRLATDTLKLFTAYSIPFFAAKALNFPIDWDMLFKIIVLTSFVFMLSSFIPLPGGAGGMEGAFILILSSVFGFATTSIMLLWRFLTFYLPMLVGFGFFARIKELRGEKVTK